MWLMPRGFFTEHKLTGGLTSHTLSGGGMGRLRKRQRIRADVPLSEVRLYEEVTLRTGDAQRGPSAGRRPWESTQSRERGAELGGRRGVGVGEERAPTPREPPSQRATDGGPHSPA